MDIKKLIELLLELKAEFSTILKIDDTKDGNGAVISLKDFDPKDEDQILPISVMITEGSDEYSEDIGLVGKRVEFFIVLAKYDYKDQRLVSLTNSVTSSLSRRFRLQYILIPAEDFVLPVLRSVVHPDLYKDNLKREFLLALKDLAAFHYSRSLSQVVSNISGAINDEDLIKSLIAGYEKKIHELLAGSDKDTL